MGRLNEQCKLYAARIPELDEAVAGRSRMEMNTLGDQDLTLESSVIEEKLCHKSGPYCAEDQT